jgi:DnaJ domain
MDDYYEILQVSQRADPEVIKAAYNRLALKYHPDRNPGDHSAEKVMKRLNEAWSVLGDPSVRSAFDRKREVEADHQAVREKETKRQPNREKETTHQAERKQETAAEGESRNHQTRRPDSNTPRAGNNSGSPGMESRPDLVDFVAILLATVGGFVTYLGATAALEIVIKGRYVDWTSIFFVLAGGGLPLAVGLGLKARKFWAVSVALWSCLAATIGSGLMFFSNMSNAPPWSFIPIGFLLSADLFFVSVRRKWNRQRRSSR